MGCCPIHNIRLDAREKADPKRKRVSSLATPLAIERQYQTQIRKTLQVSADLVRQTIVPNLPRLVEDNKVFRGDSRHTDSRLDEGAPVGEVIAALYESVNLGFDGAFSPRDFEIMAQQISIETNGWNKQQIHRVFRQGLGIDLLQGEPWLAGILETFALNNANLIKNVSTVFIDQTQQIVNEGMIKGWRHEVIAQKLLGTGTDEQGRVSKHRLSKTRANLIGRDQINKLNGQLSHLRQINAGVTHYFWRDSDDSRVRPQHSLWNNQKFSWAKGATGSIHPGDDIQCRCWPEPDFSTFKL